MFLLLMVIHLLTFPLLQEPFISQDMLSLGYLEQIHCNNLQYNTNFTLGPRRQVSYEVTNMVSMQ